MPTEDVVSTVPGVTRRVTRSQTREKRQRETSVGEDVIFCKLIRDGALRHLNPWKLSDLQRVLEMRCFEGLLSDEDLKEVYFQRMWGFKERDFVLSGSLVRAANHVYRSNRGYFACLTKRAQANTAACDFVTWIASLTTDQAKPG